MIFTLKSLADSPTLCVGQADNLKIDNGQTRVWLCRCGVADGMPYENQVTVERLQNGRWITTQTFEATPGRRYVIED